MVKDDYIWENLVAYVENNYWKLPKLYYFFKPNEERFMARDTSICDDIRVEGIDADELIYGFIEKFDVNEGDYEHYAYFTGEGFGYDFYGAKATKKLKQKYGYDFPLPMTLGMLEQAAKNGVWNIKKLHEYYLLNKKDEPIKQSFFSKLFN